MPNNNIFTITLDQEDMNYVIRSVGSCARAFEEASNSEENPQSVRDELADLAAALNNLAFNLQMQEQLQTMFGAHAHEDETDEDAEDVVEEA